MVEEIWSTDLGEMEIQMLFAFSTTHLAATTLTPHPSISLSVLQLPPNASTAMWHKVVHCQVMKSARYT